MRQYMLDKVWIEEYANLEECLAHAESNTNPRSSDSGDEGWAGCKNLADSVRVGREGYTDIRPDVDRLLV